MPTPSRGKPCPCGRGLLFENCHGKAAEPHTTSAGPELSGSTGLTADELKNIPAVNGQRFEDLPPHVQERFRRGTTTFEFDLDPGESAVMSMDGRSAYVSRPDGSRVPARSFFFSGQVAREARVAAGLSVEQLAERAQVSRATIKRAERGEGVYRTAAETIAKVLGLSLGASATSQKAPSYHSVFISYGGPDEAFARLLYESLVRYGIKAFFFPESATPGKRLHRTMETAVFEYDRVILICSEASLNRSGVLYEIEQVLSREAAEGGEELLIPLAIDDYVFVSWQPKRPDLRRQVLSRVVADFRGADVHGPAFQAQLARLLHALSQR